MNRAYLKQLMESYLETYWPAEVLIEMYNAYPENSKNYYQELLIEIQTELKGEVTI
jgi:hypothetical protein